VHLTDVAALLFCCSFGERSALGRKRTKKKKNSRVSTMLGHTGISDEVEKEPNSVPLHFLFSSLFSMRVFFTSSTTTTTKKGMCSRFATMALRV
jgi:hypothetical protein